MYSDPLAYMLTFHTYGTWHPGDDRGSVSASQNQYGAPLLPRSPRLVDSCQSRQVAESVYLDAAARAVVQGSISEACAFRQWPLLAINVRTNHVHLVVRPRASKEKMLATLKSRATRVLREAGLFGPERPIWTEHGSTRVLFFVEAVIGACHYVRHGQGAQLPSDDRWWEHWAKRAAAENPDGNAIEEPER